MAAAAGARDHGVLRGLRDAAVGGASVREAAGAPAGSRQASVAALDCLRARNMQLRAGSAGTSVGSRHFCAVQPGLRARPGNLQPHAVAAGVAAEPGARVLPAGLPRQQLRGAHAQQRHRAQRRLDAHAPVHAGDVRPPGVGPASSVRGGGVVRHQLGDAADGAGPAGGDVVRRVRARSPPPRRNPDAGPVGCPRHPDVHPRLLFGARAARPLCRGEEAVGSGPGCAFGHPANGAQAVPALAHPVQLARRGRQHAAGAARGVVQASHDSVLQLFQAGRDCHRGSGLVSEAHRGHLLPLRPARAQPQLVQGGAHR
mmetsp:Transcript_30004/g.56592  ORF Transcript_30004/g.56592 Transcript_30004/m.56592 type:complete len:314 (+) Transcript_30004:520-1461(+)